MTLEDGYNINGDLHLLMKKIEIIEVNKYKISHININVSDGNRTK